MQNTEPSIEYFGSFDESFRQRVHQLLFWGYTRAEKNIRSVIHEETAITGLISEALEDFLQSSECPDWCEYFFVYDDPPVRKKATTGRSRPRADIILKANFFGRPEYVFEAKRLRKSSHGVGKYIDKEGMGCFISGLYASRYDEAVMIGYVQSDTLGNWQAKLLKAIGNARTSLQLCSDQQSVQVLQEFPLEWVSEHERSSVGRPILIYHILLDCCP